MKKASGEAWPTAQINIPLSTADRDRSRRPKSRVIRSLPSVAAVHGGGTSIRSHLGAGGGNFCRISSDGGFSQRSERGGAKPKSSGRWRGRGVERAGCAERGGTGPAEYETFDSLPALSTGSRARLRYLAALRKDPLLLHLR